MHTRIAQMEWDCTLTGLRGCAFDTSALAWGGQECWFVWMLRLDLFMCVLCLALGGGEFIRAFSSLQAFQPLYPASVCAFIRLFVCPQHRSQLVLCISGCFRQSSYRHEIQEMARCRMGGRRKASRTFGRDWGDVCFAYQVSG